MDEKPITKEEIDRQALERNPFTVEEIDGIKEMLKKQIFEEMKDEQTLRMEEARVRREQEAEERRKYVDTMKASPDPWVDVIGMTETDKGVKVDLDWNDAFVDYLRSEGIHGADDDQVVQKWITLLLRDMADKMEERYSGDFE